MTPEEKNHVRGMAPLRFGDLENASRSKPFILVESLWRHGPSVIALGAPLFIIFFLLFSLILQKTYSAHGTILVEQTSEPRISGGNDRQLINGDVVVFARTLAMRVLDTSLLSSAIDRLSDNQKPSYLRGVTNSKKAATILATQLTANQAEGTYLIDVSLNGNKPEGLADTLEAIFKSLLDKLKAEQEAQYENSISYLHDEQSSISNNLEDAKAKLLAMTEKYGNKSVLRPTYSVDLQKIDLLQKIYYENESDLLAKEAMLKRAVKNREDLNALTIVPIAEEIVAGSMGVALIESYTYSQQQVMRGTIDGLTEKNLDRKKVEDNIQAMKDYQTHYRSNLDNFTIKNQADKRALELDTDVIKARNDYNASKEQADKLRQQLQTATEEVARTSEGVFEANELNFIITQYRERLGAISSRVWEQRLMAKSPIPVAIGQQPIVEGNSNSKGMKKVLLLSILGSFGLLAGAALAHDFLNQRVNTRRELGAAVGAPESAAIPMIGSSDGPANLFTKTCLKPGEPTEMPLRDLALRLILEHQRSGAKIISFVGAHHRSGNTSIALNVARAISAHGLDVVLAEFPTPSPGLAKYAGISPSQESASAWASKVGDPESAVELIPWVPGVSVESARYTLDAFMTNACKVADLILLDLVPLAASDIALEASVKSDLVVITAAQSVALYPQVRSTVEWIVGGGVPAVTTVLNFYRPDRLRLRMKEYFNSSNTKNIPLLEMVTKIPGYDRIAQLVMDHFGKVMEHPACKKIASNLNIDLTKVHSTRNNG